MHPTLVAGMFPLLPRTTVVGLNRGLNDENHSQCEHMVLDMPESSIHRFVKFDLVELSSHQEKKTRLSSLYHVT